MSKELKDPWGDLPAFVAWLNGEERDNSLNTLHHVNRTKGRKYLNRYLDLLAKNADFSQVTPEGLVNLVAIGGWFERQMWKCGQENRRWPSVRFNQKYIRWLCDLNPEEPFAVYHSAILSKRLGDYAMVAMQIYKHPELEGLTGLAITSSERSEHYKLWWQRLSPDVPLPDFNESWDKFEKALKEPLRGLKWKYKGQYNFLRFTSVVPGGQEGEEDHLTLCDVEAQQGLLKGAKYLIERDFVTLALKYRLVPFLRMVVDNRLKDAVAEEDPQFDALLREEVKKNPPKNMIDQWKLMERVAEQYDALPPVKKKHTSLDLDREFGDESDVTGDTWTLEDTIRDKRELPSVEVDRRGTLEALILRARLTDRQQFVIDRDFKDVPDDKIALGLDKAFPAGKPSCERNVRKVRFDYRKKLKFVVDELPLHQLEVLHSLLGEFE